MFGAYYKTPLAIAAVRVQVPLRVRINSCNPL